MIPSATAADYFPLHAGNTWIYEQSNPANQPDIATRLEGPVNRNGRDYMRWTGLPEGDLFLRQDEMGRLYVLRGDASAESLWVDFAAPDRTEFRSGVNPCNSTAMIVSRDKELDTIAGFFTKALQVEYPGSNCADAGLTSDLFAPYAGLVQRTFTTIAGPRSYTLKYARIGGVTVLEAPAVSFALALDRTVYFSNQMPPVTPERAAPVLEARMTLRNATETPLKLEYPSGQTYDLVIRNSKGEIVYTWSADKTFAAVLRTEEVSGERNYSEKIPLADGSRRPLPEGSYSVTAVLTTSGFVRYSATASFDLKYVF